MGRSSLAGACIKQWQHVYSVWAAVDSDAELAERAPAPPFVAEGPSSAAAVEVDASAADVPAVAAAAAAGSESSAVSESIALPSMKRFLCCAICSIS
jgi:hypothetical protein